MAASMKGTKIMRKASLRQPPPAERNDASTLQGALVRAKSGSSDHGLQLGRAFASIKDEATRQAIVDLVEALAKAPQ